MPFNAENFDIFRLGSVPVSYPPKHINTVALLVTPENIGALSLELEGELRYNLEAEPYFKIWVSRKSADVEGGSVCLTVYEGDWLVILWNEIRIFRQEEFEKTFSVDHGPDAVNVAPDIWVKPEGSTEIFAKVGNVFMPSAGDLGKQLTDSVGNLYPEGEGPLVDESREPGETQG